MARSKIRVLASQNTTKAKREHNALLHLFSAGTDLLRYGATHYRLRSKETSTVLLQLFERYRLEVTPMPDVLEQFAKETIKELLKGMSADDLLAALPPETRAALAQRLKEDGSLQNPKAHEPEHNQGHE
jgi:hypothetical protein